MMTGTYTLTTVFTFAKDIAFQNKAMYQRGIVVGKSQDIYPVYYLEDVKALFKFCEKIAKNTHPQIAIHTFNYDEIDVVSGHYAAGNKYDIFLGKNENWRKFGIVRECCALYADHYLNREFSISKTTDIIEYINQSSKKDFTTITNIDELDFDNDTFSSLLAAELMTSPLHRKYIEELINQYRAKKVTLNNIAKSLEIPEIVLESIINSNYFQESNEFYSL